jgi:outer membrane lipoprotein-sorting protein
MMLMTVTALSVSASNKAQQVLSAVTARLDNAPSVSVKFHFVTSSGNINGTMTMAHDKFKFTTPQMSAWYNGRELWSLNSSSTEVNLSEPTEDELLEVNPMAILRGYGTLFDVTMQGESLGMKSVKFTAKSKNNQVATASLVVDDKTNVPKSLTINFRNGTRLIAIIDNVTNGAALADDSFNFPKNSYKNYQVIDLR